MATTISTNDIRDKAITSSKLDNNLLVSGDLTLSQSKIIVPGDNLMVMDSSSTIKGVVARSLLVSSSISDLSEVPSPDGSAYFKGNVKIDGDLNLKGSLKVTNTETIELSDNIILLNSNVKSTTIPSQDSGIEINRGSQPNVSLLWNESNKYWMASSGGSSYSRVIDQTFGDSRYVNKAGDTMTGPLIINKAHRGVLLGLYSSNANSILRMGHSATSYGFDWKYTGEESGVNNSLELWTDGGGADGTKKVLRVQQDGVFRVIQDINASGNIIMDANKTVDGVDIAKHNANSIANVKHVTDAFLGGLAGTHGTPGASNKYVTNTDTRLSNARVPVTHGDSSHNKLSYFDLVTDGTASKAASNNNRKMKFIGTGGASVDVTSDSSHDAIIKITSENSFLKLTSSSQQNVTGNVNFANNIVINGSLEVKGPFKVTETETVEISDNIILLNSNVPSTTTPTQNAGFEINRGKSANVSFLWNESKKYWESTSDGSTYHRVVDQAFSDSQYAKIGTHTVKLSGEVKGSKALTNNGSGLWDISTEIDSIKMNFNPAFIDNFNKDSRASWTASGATLDSPRNSTMRMTTTGTNSYIYRSSLSIDGGIDKYVLIRYRYISGSMSSGEMYYETEDHAYTNEYRGVFTLNSDGEWHTLVLNMHNLSSGGADWATNTITGIRFDPTNTNGATFDIDFIAVGSVGYGGNYVSDDLTVDGEINANSAINVNDQIKIYNGPTLMGDISATDTTWLRINAAAAKNIYTSRGMRVDKGITSGSYSMATNEVRSDIFRGGDTSYYVRPGNATTAGLFAGNVAIKGTSASEALDITGFAKSSSGYKVGTNIVISSSLDHTGRNANFTGTTTLKATSIAGTLNMNNSTITGVNHITINDPGPHKGLSWNGTSAGWAIDVTPETRANADGNLNLYGTKSDIVMWRPVKLKGTASTLVVEGTGVSTFAGSIGVGTVAPDESIHTVEKIKADQGFTTGKSIIEYDAESKTLNFNFID